jgi:hypothetical protein
MKIEILDEEFFDKNGPHRAVFLLMLARFLATPAKPHRAINFT